MEDSRNINSEEQLSTEKLQEVSGGVNTFEEATQNVTHLAHPSNIESPITGTKTDAPLQDIRLSDVEDTIKG